MQYRERALEVAERELNNSALLLSRHFDQQLQRSPARARRRRDRHAGGRGRHRRRLRAARCRRLSAHEMLRTKLAVLPHVGALNLWSAKGWLINSSEMWPVPDVSHHGPALLPGVHVGKADARRDRRAGRQQGDQGLDDGVRAQDRRPQRRDHRLCRPRRRAFPFRGLCRIAGAGQRYRDLDDSPRRHHHRPLSEGRQPDRPQRRRYRPAFQRALAVDGNISGRFTSDETVGRQGRRGQVAGAFSRS